ncbi:MAG: tetratricopeptide repeat protein [Gemmatimonadetes bacterium]|nr:tetratricopeptide repeat protein [Gemmatimonadota bacterium]MBT7861108.1 tetratricopeptide repeat protein [Gemmatimonadota bacterium]
MPFLNTLGNGFHDDDQHAILQNHHLRALTNIPSFFLDSSTFSGEPGKGMYRPVFQTTLALNYAVGGDDPRGYHLVSIAFHALTCLGLLLTASRFVPFPLALAATLLFAVHPIHTQAINYISSRSELMATCGVIWALWCVLRGRIWGGAALFALALLSKSVAIHFLPILLLAMWILADRTRLARVPSDAAGVSPAASGPKQADPTPADLVTLDGRIRWHRVLPFAAVAAAYGLIISLEGFLPRSLAQDVRPLTSQIATQAQVVVLYLQALCMPVRLSIEHGLLPTTAANLHSWICLLFICSLGGLGGLGLRRSAWKVSGFGLGWFFVGLGVTSLVPLTVIASEQRLYLSTAGLLIALVALIGGDAGHRRLRPIAGSVLVATLLVMGTLSVERNSLWENELTLWSDAAEKAPHSPRAQGNLALALHEAGDLEAAGRTYKQAIGLDRGHPRIRTNYGTWLEESGQWQEAEQQYLTAARHHWSGARVQLGRLYLAQGRLQMARDQLDLALQVNPTDVEAHHHLGRWHQANGDPVAALGAYREALRIDPAYAPAANNLGLLLVDAGDVAAGRQSLARAAERDPDGEAIVNLAYVDLRTEGQTAVQAYEQLWARYPERPTVALALIRALAREGAWSSAVQVIDAARDTHPLELDFVIAAGDAYRATGNWQEAIEVYTLALKGRSADVSLRNRLAASLAAAGHPEAAIVQTRRVLAQDAENAVARRNLKRLLSALPDLLPGMSPSLDLDTVDGRK